MSVVRSDKHGLYIKCGGYIFRPLHPAGYKHRLPGNSAAQAGDKVKARHLGGTPIARLRLGSGEEDWHSHGAYLGNPRYNGSESCYKPAYECWE